MILIDRSSEGSRAVRTGAGGQTLLRHARPEWLFRADEGLPPRLELVEEERAVRSALDAHGAEAGRLDGVLGVVDPGHRGQGGVVDPQLERAVACPRTRGAHPVELDHVWPIRDREETGVGSRA